MPAKTTSRTRTDGTVTAYMQIRIFRMISETQSFYVPEPGLCGLHRPDLRPGIGLGTAQFMIAKCEARTHTHASLKAVDPDEDGDEGEDDQPQDQP